MNKMLRNTAAALLACSLGVAHAGHDERGPGRGFGKVLHVKPVYETVTETLPPERCRQRHDGGYFGDRDSALVGTLVGGVLGGVLGNQVGGGNGRTAMTIAGTVIGAVVGNRVGEGVDARAARGPDYACTGGDYAETHEALVGYRVKYRYRGQVFTTHTDYDPGDWIRVDRRSKPVQF